MSEWIETPKVDMPIIDPKGRVGGTVRVVGNDAGKVYVDTDQAWQGDRRAAFRDREWHVSMHLYREDGEWVPRDDAPWVVQHDDGPMPGREAAPTHRAAIVAAVIATIAERWTAELDRRASYARACQTLNRMDHKAAALRAELEQIEAEAAPLREIVHYYERSHTDGTVHEG